MGFIWKLGKYVFIFVALLLMWKILKQTYQVSE